MLKTNISKLSLTLKMKILCSLSDLQSLGIHHLHNTWQLPSFVDSAVRFYTHYSPASAFSLGITATAAPSTPAVLDCTGTALHSFCQNIESNANAFL